jgi:hypothetical protein
MRRDGKPKRARHLNIAEEQYETLVTLADLSEDGAPSISSMIRRAIEEYIERRLEKVPGLREKVEARLNRGKLVPIRAD